MPFSRGLFNFYRINIMQEKINKYDYTPALNFFRRWRKWLIIVFVAAAIISLGISLTITPLYKSTAVIFPSNTNRLSKAIMGFHYSMDFMDYGGERDCEYALQILNSRTLEEAVCERFDLATVYKIPADHPHLKYELSKRYNSHISFKRTEFMGVRIAVLDKDPQRAADIANYIVAKYDTLCHEIHHERAVNAAEIMDDVCRSMEREIDSLAASNANAVWKDKLIADRCKELANLQTRASETRVDKDQSISYKYSVDEAIPSDKKAFPKRSLIVMAGSFGTLVVFIFGLLIFAKKEEE